MKTQSSIKDYDFKTILNLLMITANEIAYPQDAPPNTSDKTPPQGSKNYGKYDLRNYTDNQGWIPVKIDFRNFKPKKYYKDTDQETLEKHLQALQKQQDLIKHFKHHEDFDRIDYHASRKSNTWQNHIDKMLFAHGLMTLIFSRILTVQIFFHKFSLTLWRNIFFRTYFTTFPIMVVIGMFYQVGSPVNHEYFRSNPHSVRIYESMAYGTDSFQYNNDLKYNFKYPKSEDFDDVLDNVFERRTQSLYQDALNHYKREYGIVDKEPYLKMDKKKQTKEAI